MSYENCPNCNADSSWLEEEYPYIRCWNCDEMLDDPKVEAIKAKATEDSKAADKLESGLFAVRSPEAEEEAREAKIKAEAEMKAKASREITLTYLGDSKANYVEYPDKDIVCQVNSSDHWQAMIAKAEANAKAAGKTLTIINKNMDGNPYGN